ncbi:MAG: pirin family protein [Saprospiraceae bacterium]
MKNYIIGIVAFSFIVLFDRQKINSDDSAITFKTENRHVISSNINHISIKTKKMTSDKIIRVQQMGFPWATEDPFLFCVHHEDNYPKGEPNLGPDSELLKGRNIGNDFVIKDGWRMYHGDVVPGFPHHPHRGFETVTVAEDGYIDHADSQNGLGRFSDGDVQWMTAGKGILHSEMFPLLDEDKPNRMELFQIWLNLPKKDKMVEPHYKMLWSESIPSVTEIDANGKNTSIRIIAGELNGSEAPKPTPNSWAANDSNNVAIWTIKMEAGANWTLPKTNAGINRTLYFYRGNQIQIDNTTLEKNYCAKVKSDEDIVIVAGQQDAYLLLLQGKPINEPVVQHGPFVMNTRQEIQEAFMDYQRTQFGGWKWKASGPTHGKEKRRFAQFSDGSVIEK